jgi:hypothetical protein
VTTVPDSSGGSVVVVVEETTPVVIVDGDTVVVVDCGMVVAPVEGAAVEGGVVVEGITRPEVTVVSTGVDGVAVTVGAGRAVPTTGTATGTSSARSPTRSTACDATPTARAVATNQAVARPIRCFIDASIPSGPIRAG